MQTILDSTRRRTSAEVVDHLRRHRDELSKCILAFSGGKDSVLLARLVHAAGVEVPMVYASSPGCEWPEHEEFVRRFGARMLDTGHNWDWFEANPWAFLHRTAALAERWARQHHRGILRRLARAEGKTLLWGNRTADGNTVPGSRYIASDGTSLWMPCRDLPDSELGAIEQDDWSPIYKIPGCKGSGYMPGRLRGDAEERRQEVKRRVEGTEAWARFERLYSRLVHA